ncbi:hypothetical protein GGU10DRAFT_344610 [Lentinula aff. detonsa]|uniref:Uncharacterized protein n=1 Tax=Lentinula aff. detonsa TaxID=2804958 RepID=A0AA38NQA0_9AGAR|nr:hypothetical protein GGU10DRAFT_344610 [Lentinula aff. detonsa]
MMQAQYQSLYIFLVISSTLVLSILDALKQVYAEGRVMIGICFDATILSWIPLSIYLAFRVLRQSIEGVPTSILPLRRIIRRSQSQVSGQPKDFIVLLGLGHTWLMFSRLSYAIFNQTISNSTIPSPLLFIFCHGSSITLASSIFTIIVFGICLQMSGISQSRWGYFLFLYGIATVPLKKFATVSRWVIALSEGQIGILERDGEEDEEIVPGPSPLGLSDGSVENQEESGES